MSLTPLPSRSLKMPLYDVDQPYKLSDTTTSTPLSPLAYKSLKKSDQLSSVSLFSNSIPKISLYPSWLIPVAKGALKGLTCSPSFVLMTMPSLIWGTLNVKVLTSVVRCLSLYPFRIPFLPCVRKAFALICFSSLLLQKLICKFFYDFLQAFVVARK